MPQQLTNLRNGYTALIPYLSRPPGGSGQLFDPAQFAKETSKSVTRPQIQALDDVHRGLDAVVLDTYGWPHNLTNEEILERLLALNLERGGDG